MYFLYMFWATMCPSSGETIVFMWHLVLVILYGWLSGMQRGMKHSTLHTRQSSIQSDEYKVSHRYSYFSWWWAHSCPKHVEKRNNHTKKNCAPSWLYLQDYTAIHGQLNIKEKRKPLAPIRNQTPINQPIGQSLHSLHDSSSYYNLLIV